MNRGFSLVELSIVLVILGLLTGGILAGQSLIRAAELRAVTTEHDRYRTAVQTFRDKYFGLPGDITNAHKFWGAADGGDGTGSDCRMESATTATCSGDGNGQICYTTACTAGTWEKYQVWKQLANAGLIEGSYSGASGLTTPANTICVGSAANQSLAGCNVPASKFGNGYWEYFYVGNITSDPYMFDGSYGNSLQLVQTSLKPVELWSIDVKVDDGRPAYGNLVAWRWNFCATGAANTADLASANYLTNPASWQTGYTCIPIFRNFF